MRRNPDALIWEPVGHAPWWLLAGRQPPANLAFADLTGLDLCAMAAERANLRGVLCQHKDLSGSNLRGALMVDGLFAHSTFSGADLSLVRLEGADFSYCDLRGADLTDTVFAQTALKGARGVDWDRVGPGRWLVTRHEGVAHGGLGELEQDFVFEVSDQKSGKTIARYEASLYQSYWGCTEPTTCGPVRVEITPDGFIRLVGDDGKETLYSLPT